MSIITEPVPSCLDDFPTTYIDVFAGCGGLSLGLHRAGWSGMFAIEKNDAAFATLEANFLKADSKHQFAWPSWLAQKPWDIEDLLTEHGPELISIRGKVGLLAGGPPCQGFSSAGRRRADDPRNALIDRYLELVKTIEPKMILIENVKGFTQNFKARADRSVKDQENAADKLVRQISDRYDVISGIVLASDFGVPQRRQRFILVGILKSAERPTPRLEDLSLYCTTILERYGISADTSASDALSDLEISSNDVLPCRESPGFDRIGYRGPQTPYQRAMQLDAQGEPGDTRLARHSQKIRERFADIIEACGLEGRSTKSLSGDLKERFGIKKMATRVLDRAKPAPTVTSMPDDLIHYSEPRTLTVRENARLQSFPDWFEFKGKYTSGGDRRRFEVPRFTQVANAVPPLLSEVIGTWILASTRK